MVVCVHAKQNIDVWMYFLRSILIEIQTCIMYSAHCVCIECNNILHHHILSCCSIRVERKSERIRSGFIFGFLLFFCSFTLLHYKFRNRNKTLKFIDVFTNVFALVYFFRLLFLQTSNQTNPASYNQRKFTRNDVWVIKSDLYLVL